MAGAQRVAAADRLDAPAVHTIGRGAEGPGVLIQIAESLFWIGRQVERSDGTARILDAHLQFLLENPWVEESVACQSLLRLMGGEPPPHRLLTRKDVLARLGADRAHPASIGHSVRAARETARLARDIVPVELWECLNTTSARMPRTVASERAHDFFGWVRDRAALAVGIVESGVRRDEVWRFFTLGRSLEQADMTARLLATRVLTEAGGPSWITILRSGGAYESYLRTHGGVPSARNAAEFLLRDRLFPRSIVFSLARAEQSLRGLDLQTGTELSGVPDPAEQVLSEIRGELDGRPIMDILDDLPQQLIRVQDALRCASTAITSRHFPAAAGAPFTGQAS